MKIGIVTFHRAHNCGAALQSVALVKAFRKMGHEALILDVEDIGEARLVPKFAGLRAFLGWIHGVFVNRAATERLWLKYRRFQKRFMPMTRRIGLCERFPEGFGRVVLGSDQVLSPKLKRSVLEIYLLKNRCVDERKYSYASSFGVKALPFEVRELYAEELSRFQSIGVREESGAEICRKELGLKRRPVVVLDPTLLLEASDYSEFETPVKTSGEYVLVYFIGPAKEYVLSLARKIAAERGLKVVVASVTAIRGADEEWHATDPGEFLWLIRHANSIVTTSFHGTAFSIINRKPFLSVIPKESKVADRVINLLDRLGLSSQSIQENDDLAGAAAKIEMAYDIAEERLQMLRRDSLAYLASIPRLPGTTCTGCTACRSVCHVKAINMVADDRGFLVPKVDEAKCVNCGACTRACPVLKDLLPVEPIATYIAKAKDLSVRMGSASGGVFTELAENVLSNGGTVYGAGWNKDFTVSHQRAATHEELQPLRGSKYVQSDVGDVFGLVKRDLADGRKVLFTGTPCQVAGLTNSLGKDYDNLLLVALMCHSVCSPDMLRWYLADLEKKTGTEVSAINFRDKVDGKSGRMMSVAFRDATKQVIMPLWENDYAKAYFHSLDTRESCFACRFRHNRCGADIVIGDYWGAEKRHPEFVDGCGVSAVLALTQKGAAAVRANKGIILEQSEYAAVLRGNPYLAASVGRNNIHALRFRNVYRKIPFGRAVAYALGDPLKVRICRKLSSIGRHLFKLFKGNKR